MADVHTAAKNGDVSALVSILDADKGSVNELDVNGNSPLHWAAMYGRVNVAALLVERGSDVHLQNSGGKLASEIADFNGYAELANMLRKGSLPPAHVSASSSSASGTGSTTVAQRQNIVRDTERPTYIPRSTTVTTKYHGLRSISGFLKFVGYMFILAGVICGIGLFVAASHTYGDQTMGFILAVASGMSGLLYGVITIALGELAVVMVDIEENTRAVRQNQGM